jgi:hypothetical protein
MGDKVTIIVTSDNGHSQKEIQQIFWNNAVTFLKPYGEIGYHREEGGDGRDLFWDGKELKENEAETMLTVNGPWRPEIDHALLEAQTAAKNFELDMAISYFPPQH